MRALIDSFALLKQCEIPPLTIFFFGNCQVIKGRYEAKGDKHETDEFLKPIIVDPEGRIKGLCSILRGIKLKHFDSKERRQSLF